MQVLESYLIKKMSNQIWWVDSVLPEEAKYHRNSLEQQLHYFVATKKSASTTPRIPKQQVYIQKYCETLKTQHYKVFLPTTVNNGILENAFQLYDLDKESVKRRGARLFSIIINKLGAHNNGSFSLGGFGAMIQGPKAPLDKFVPLNTALSELSLGTCKRNETEIVFSNTGQDVELEEILLLNYKVIYRFKPT